MYSDNLQRIVKSLLEKNPRDRSSLDDILELVVITKNAKLQLPEDVYAAEFLNYDSDKASNAALDDEKKVEKHAEAPMIVPVKKAIVPTVEPVFKAKKGVEDTQKLVGQDIVSFGTDGSKFWGPTRLKDGTVVEFAGYSGYSKITEIDERNLSQCRCLNLMYMFKLSSIKLEKLYNLCLLIIWYSGIKVIDLTSLVHLELVICGAWYNDYIAGLQEVRVGAGVAKSAVFLDGWNWNLDGWY